MNLNFESVCTAQVILCSVLFVANLSHRTLNSVYSPYMYIKQFIASKTSIFGTTTYNSLRAIDVADPHSAI